MNKSVSPVAAWESLFRAQVTVMRQIAEEFPSDCISLNEYDVLFTLSIAPEYTLRIRELNENVLLTQPSISRLVDRLTARGILAKVVDPNDGRGTLVTLTEEGFATYTAAAKVHGCSIASRMSTALSPAELTELNRLCTKLRLSVTGAGSASGAGAASGSRAKSGSGPDLRSGTGSDTRAGSGSKSGNQAGSGTQAGSGPGTQASQGTGIPKSAGHAK